jgi:hypothetical protein
LGNEPRVINRPNRTAHELEKIKIVKALKIEQPRVEPVESELNSNNLLLSSQINCTVELLVNEKEGEPTPVNITRVIT